MKFGGFVDVGAVTRAFHAAEVWGWDGHFGMAGVSGRAGGRAKSRARWLGADRLRPALER